MTHIFNLGELDDEFSEKINLDELYEKKRKLDQSKLDLFNKLLNRAHNKIKLTSRQQIDEQFCWFQVPEVMIGVPKYDQGECIAYIINKLKENGFLVKYIHPNVIFICWNHWIPGYVRNEIKKKTGMRVDGNGMLVGEKETNEGDNVNSLVLNNKTNDKKTPVVGKVYKPIDDYTPTGNLVYNSEMINKLDKKL